MSDPARIEELGIGLAAATRELAPTRVLCWEGIEDRLLAHVVARELGVTVVMAMNASGLLDFEGTFGPADRVVIVANAQPHERDLTAMQALVRQHHGEVVAVLVPTEGIR